MYIFEGKKQDLRSLAGPNHVLNVVVFDLSGVSTVPSSLFTYISPNIIYTNC